MKREEFKRLKERKIQLFSKLKLRNFFPGEWDSVYKGEGMEFADTRPFEPGDNPRDMDYLALAQSGEELIVERVETRQLRVYVWADYSGSLQHFERMLFPQKPWIRDIALGLILFSAVKIYSPISFYPFGLAKKKFFPPRMGERYCREILDWAADEENLRHFVSSGVESVIDDLAQLAQQKNMVFFISDFKQKVFEGDFTGLLKKIAGKFDFIPVAIQDPVEKYTELSRAVRIKVRNSGRNSREEEIHLTPNILREMQEVSQKHLLNLDNNFRKIGIERLVLDSASIDDCCRAFSNFFQVRKRVIR